MSSENNNNNLCFAEPYNLVFQLWSNKFGTSKFALILMFTGNVNKTLHLLKVSSCAPMFSWESHPSLLLDPPLLLWLRTLMGMHLKLRCLIPAAAASASYSYHLPTKVAINVPCWGVTGTIFTETPKDDPVSHYPTLDSPHWRADHTLFYSSQSKAT